MGKQVRDSGDKTVVAQAYRGMTNPRVELNDDDSLYIRLNPEGGSEEAAERASGDNIRVSLENIVVEMHNQSYGMISASTGCVSNPGGPSC